MCWYQSLWYHKQVYHLLNDYKTARVIHDIPKSATPIINHVANVIYKRIDGPQEIIGTAVYEIFYMSTQLTLKSGQQKVKLCIRILIILQEMLLII